MKLLNKIKKTILNIALFVAFLFVGAITVNIFVTNDKISISEHEKVKSKYEENTQKLKTKEEELKKLDPKKAELQEEIDKLISEVEAAEN